MANSPGRSVGNAQRREQEVKYIARLRDIPKAELIELLPFTEASKIDNLAENHLSFSKCLNTNSDDVRFNTAMYDDRAEEFIYNKTLAEIIDASRKVGDHESAENVRILRSARAVLYYTMQEGKDGI